MFKNKKFIGRRIVAAVVALSLIASGIGLRAYANDKSEVGSKGSLTSYQYITGLQNLSDNFGNHSIQKLKMDVAGQSDDLAAFCIAPGVKINTEKSNPYTATSNTCGYATRYYKAALSYRLEHTKEEADIHRIAAQLWCWQIYKAHEKNKGKAITANDVINATSGFKSDFIAILSDSSLQHNVRNFDLVSASRAENIYNDSLQYIVKEGSEKKHTQIDLLKWTCPSAQTVITGKKVKDRSVKLQVKKTGSALGKEAFLAGCKYKVYADADCTDPVKAYKSKEDAVMTIKADGTSNVVTLPAASDKEFAYYVKEEAANEGTVKNSTPYPAKFAVGLSENDVVVLNTKNNEKNFRLDIHKKGDDGVNLSGVTFAVKEKKNGNWEQIDSKTTGSDGKLSFGPYYYSKENHGEFMVVETACTNTAYIKTNWSKVIKLADQNAESKTYTYDVINPRNSIDLIINKLDSSTGAMIPEDTGFLLCEITTDLWNKYHNNLGSAVSESVSTIDGVRQSDGTYLFKGAKPNTRYIIDEYSRPNGWLRGSEIVEAKVVSGDCSIVKDYLELNAPLYSGTGFQDRADYYIPIITGNTSGSSIVIDVFDDEAAVSLKCYKEDTETGKKAQGDANFSNAVFGVYDVADDSLVTTITTRSNGEGESEVKLNAKTNYYVKEIVAPKGYKPNPEKHYVDETWNGYYGYQKLNEERKVVVKDDVIKGSVEAYKYTVNPKTGQQEPVSGVEFGLYLCSSLTGWNDLNYIEYDYSKYTPITTFKTGSDGLGLSSEIPYGQYVLVELSHPANLLNAEPVVIDIDDSFEFKRDPVYVEVLDPEFEAKLEIVKKDADTGEIIKKEGNTFKILNLDTNEYVKMGVLEITKGSFEDGDYETELVYTSMFTTNKDGKVLLPDTLLHGNYQIEEVEACPGYKLNKTPLKVEISDSQKYEIDPDTLNPVISVTFENEAITGVVDITKRGEAVSGFEDNEFVYKNASLAGAMFDVYAAEDIYSVSNDTIIKYQKDELVKTVTTGDDGVARADKLIPATYYVREHTAPLGFTRSDEQKDIEIVEGSKDTLQQEVTFTNERQKTDLSVLKEDVETKLPLKDAVFGVYVSEDIKNNAGEVVVPKDTLIEQITSDEYGIAKLTKDYPVNAQLTVKELVPPKGYTTSRETISIIIEPQNDDVKTITNRYVIGDKPKEVSVTKYDITTQKESPGNKLKVSYIDEDGKEIIVDSWTSGDTEHIIKYIEVNKSYTLTETKPADGYCTAAAINFTVKDDDTVDAVKMYNDVTKLKISKTDITTGELVVGARLQIINSNGEIVQDFITTNNPDDGYFERLPMGTYILKEIYAPEEDGYIKAQDIKFEIKDTNEIQKVEMKDDYTKVKFFKKDSTSNDNVKGAVLTLKDDLGNVVETWETDGSEHVINYIKPGKYILSENFDETPFGYLTAEDLEIEILPTGEVQEFTMLDDRVIGQIFLTKLDKKDDTPLKGAVFEVRDSETDELVCKMVTDESGTAASGLITVGKYKDGECIGMKKFIVSEVKAPRGYILPENKQYKVEFEYVDGADNILMYNVGKVYNVHKDSIFAKTGDGFHPVIMFILAGLVVALTGASTIYSTNKRKKKQA
ncbi:MAG: hypothetical protein K6G88_11090 [Lachnospiraceae bacterium]|nr:hypothetical protein [Lachnospiraceae bacterium]